MKKLYLPLILGIILILVLIGYFSVFKKASKPSEYQAPKSEYQVPEKGKGAEEYVYKIRGIGFKKEAWAEYKMEGYGVRFHGSSETPLVGKILVKLISLPIKGKEYYGIEIDGKEDSPIEGIIFAMVFEKEGEGNYYLIKISGAPTLCMSQVVPGYEDIPEFFDKKSIEPEYKVDLSTWHFIGEDQITLESGKKIKVFKFKIETFFEGEKSIHDLWLSPEVPTYIVLNRETIGDKSRSITLTNFGMDGGLPNFANEDLKACESEGVGLPQLPLTLPPQVSKMFCQTDADCACGVDKETGQCAFGNKNFIDTSKQCADFCTGIFGHMRIKCVNNLCTPEIGR